MKKLISLLTAVLLLVGCTADTPALTTSAADPVRLVFATDLHYLSPQLTDGGEGFLQRVSNGDGKMLHYINPITDAFVAGLLADPPDALILGGDMTLNGELLSHKELVAKLSPLHKAGVPILTLPGNHDVDNFMAARFVARDRELVDSIDPEQFAKLYGKLDAEPLSRDTDSLSVVYPLRTDLWVLLLDVYESVTPGRLSDPTWDWLTSQLQAAQAQGVTVITATHQNVLQHNPNFSSGYVIEEGDRLAALLTQYGVPLNLTGHIHMQNLAEKNGLHEAATSSLAVTPCQYANITFDGDTITYATQLVDVAGWAQTKGLTDSVLLGFPTTARQFFWDVAYDGSYAQLLDANIDTEKSDQMATYYADINTDYFQGTASPHTAGEPAYDLWTQYGSEEFFYPYIGSMLQSANRDHNSLTITGK